MKNSEKNKLRKINIVNELSDGNINDAVEEVRSFLFSGKCAREDVLRLSLSLENTLINFLSVLGKDTPFQISCTGLFHTLTVTVSVPGREAAGRTDDDDFDAIVVKMLKAGNTFPEYSYDNGVNRVKYEVHVKNRLSLTQKSLISIAVGVIVGMLALFVLPPDLSAEMNDRIVSPIFSTFIGVVSAVAGLMIFLTVTQSIYLIGDRNTFQKVGGLFFRNTLLIMFGVSIVSTVVCSFLFRSGETQSGQFDLYQVFDVILQIIPTNIISPFLNGSVLQILFTAVFSGIVILALGSRVTVVRQFINQCSDIVSHIMEYLIRLMPYFIAFSVFTLLVGNEFSDMVKGIKLLLVFVIMTVFAIAVSVIYTAVRWKKPLPRFVRELMPAFIMSFTTASSSAALPMCVDICENKMGIDKTLTSFGVPMSNAVYKIGSVIYRVTLVFGLAEIFGIAITPVWMVNCVVLSFFLSIAVPAIPGAGMSTLTLLLVQLGIPSEALVLAIACDIIMDNLSTACNVVCGITELINIAGDLKMIRL